MGARMRIITHTMWLTILMTALAQHVLVDTSREALIARVAIQYQIVSLAKMVSLFSPLLFFTEERESPACEEISKHNKEWGVKDFRMAFN